MAHDLIIRNARLPQRDELVDIGVREGVFARIAPAIRESAAREIDAGGRLVSPPLIDCHVHVVASTSPSQSRLFRADHEEPVTFVPNAPSTAD